MAQPTPYDPTTDFSQEEANAVAGRSTVRTAALDAELSAIALTLSQVLANLALLQRDDTKVANEIIHPDSLDPNTKALMTGKWNPRGAWSSGTEYVNADLVTMNGDSWVCAVAHVAAASFAADEAAGRWVRVAGVSHDELGSTLTGAGASLVAIEDAGNLFAAGDVEAALAEILSRLAATTTGDGASMVAIEDAGNLFTATDVEAALAEILTRLASVSAGDGASLVGVEDAMGYFTGANVEELLAEIGAQLVPASTTAQGFVELATVDEAAAGTDASRAVTAEALAGALSMDALLKSMGFNRETKILGLALSSVNFGKAVAISADGITLILARNQRIYEYRKSGGGWAQQAEFYATDANIGYVSDVAVSADGNTVVVGYYTANDGSNMGVAYVFVRSGGGWSQQAKLSASDGLGAYFGERVAISADGDTVACGSRLTDYSTTTDTGAVYVYSRTGTTWTEQAILKDSFLSAYDYFGSDVALSADGNVLAVGVPGRAYTTNADQGQVWVYERSGTAWSGPTYVTASDGAAGDQLGSSVTLSADGQTLAAGAPYADPSETDRGAVYVFTRNQSGWYQRQKLTSYPGDLYFGKRVALSADGRHLVSTSSGAPVNGVSGVGKVYWHRLQYGSWTEKRKFAAADAATGDAGYGDKLAITPAGHIVVIGAPGFDETYGDQGAVYVHEKTVF